MPNSIAQSHIFTAKHIEDNRFDAPQALAEQAVHCLELVAELVKAGLSFQFKGGNSLLLILNAPKRFSIDVDIATDESREDIEARLDKIIEEYNVFKRWNKRQHKTKPWLPIASYYLFYNSNYVDPENSFIMLDVQLRRSPYKTEMKQIACTNLFTCKIKAELPLPGSIIGDKLLTVGPYTLGIPTGKGKEAQRLKHVYDISCLLDINPKLNDIRESFFKCLDHENNLQEDKKTAEEVMLDTIGFCWSVMHNAEFPRITAKMSSILRENVIGLEPFAGHLFSREYTWAQLQLDMARLALCISAVFREEIDDDIFYNVLKGNKDMSCKNNINRSQISCDENVRKLWGYICCWIGNDNVINIDKSRY